MKQLKSYSKCRPWLGALTLSALAVGCGGGDGGRDPILGADVTVTDAAAIAAPVVTAVAPANNATNVAINNTQITAAFSEPMSFSGPAAFTVTCAAPCVSPVGSVALDPTNSNATFSLASGASLTPSTAYKATVSGPTSLATGLALASPYVWNFTTGATPDTTRPRVSFTVPATTVPGPTAGVPANTAISAVFTEDMAAATITSGSFTLTCAAPCVSPAGTVNYSVGSKKATYTPAAALEVGRTYTATVTSMASDLAGNKLAGNAASLPAASNYVWTFTTAAPVAAATVSVLSTNPAAGAANVCTDASINANFSVPSGLEMDPATVNAATFTVTGPAPVKTPVTAASVVLDGATGRIASFTPLAPLTAGVTYSAVIKGGANGVKDLAVPGNQMPASHAWSFTAINCIVPPVPSAIVLGAAAPFASYGGTAGMTNQGIDTVINGDIGTTAVSTAVTGFHDTGANVYTETPLNKGAVNGIIYTYPPAPGNAATKVIADAALAAAQVAYNQLVAKPAGAFAGAGELGSLTLAPGTYTSATSYKVTAGDLTLDAQGDPNAVFVFQMGSSLTVGIAGPTGARSIVLKNGAQAKNVFWQVGTSATINGAGGGFMKGTIIAQQAVTFSTTGNAKITVLDGRALSLISGVTMVNTHINLP